MNSATDHITFPSKIDASDLTFPALTGWMLAEDCRVIVLHDDSPSHPFDSWDTGCTFHWEDTAPWWDKAGIGHSNEDLGDFYQHRPDSAVLFSVAQQRDGNHYYIEDDPSEGDTLDVSTVDGYIIVDGYITDPGKYVEGVLETLTYWSTGESYWWRKEHRVTWTNCDDDTRYTWEPDDSCNGSGYYGMENVIEGIRDVAVGWDAEGVTA